MSSKLSKISLSIVTIIGVTSSLAAAQSANSLTCKSSNLDRRQDLVIAQEQKCEKFKEQKEKLQENYTSLKSDQTKAGIRKLRSLKSLISRTDKQIKSVCKRASDDRRKFGALINSCKKFTEPTPKPTSSPTPNVTPSPTPPDKTFLPPAGCTLYTATPAFPGKIKLTISNLTNGTASEILGDGSSLCIKSNLKILGGNKLKLDVNAEYAEGIRVAFEVGEDSTCRERNRAFLFPDDNKATITTDLYECVRGQELKIHVNPQGSTWTANKNGLTYVSEKIGSADGNPDPEWFTTANKCTAELFSDSQPSRPGRIKIDALNLRTQQRSEILLNSGYYCNALSTPYVPSLPGDVIELRVAAENADQLFINVSSAGYVNSPNGEQTPNCPSVSNIPNMHFFAADSVTRQRFTMPQCLVGTEMKFSVQPMGKSWANFPAAHSAAKLEIR